MCRVIFLDNMDNYCCQRNQIIHQFGRRTYLLTLSRDYTGKLVYSFTFQSDFIGHHDRAKTAD